MLETTEQSEARKSPLDERHVALGARMKEDGGWRLPASYGDSDAEYSAVRRGGAGLIDLSSRGRLEVYGSEAEQFLNGLITNDVKALKEGAWMQAAFPNVQGRLVASVRVLKLGADRFLFDTEAATSERVYNALARFTLAGDFHVTELAVELALLSVQGAGAQQVVGAVLGEDAAGIERGRVREVSWRGQTIHLIRATHTAEDGLDLFAPSAEAGGLWEALAAAGARPVGSDAFELLRLEAGIPRYGVDVDETNVVLEAIDEEAVSYTKGCYVGQEIIARIHWRGHVAKKLTGLGFDAPCDIARGDKVRAADGREIGRITSVARSPALGRTIALGYVKYDYLAPGTEVRVVSNESEITARVSSLPFVRGSWYEAADEAVEGGA